MESQRQQKISKLLQKDLSVIFREQAVQFEGAMITVTKVYITKDLSISKVFLSIFAVKDKTALLEKIKQHSSEIRYILGKRIKNQLRIIPELQFYLDDSLDYLENIEEILK